MFGRAKMLLIPLMFVLASFLNGCGETEKKSNLNLETARAKAKSCVEPTADMRKNHMKYLLHERDETMYEGIRGKDHSFKACINCHIPAEKEGKPVNYLMDDHSSLNPEHFCATCHAYVSVKLDCFECHSDNPEQQQGKAPASHAAFGNNKATVATTQKQENDHE